MTGDQLLQWIKLIQATGLIDPASRITLEIDYGKRIDRRHKTDNDLRPVYPPWWKRLFSFHQSYAVVSEMVFHEHDFELEVESFDELISRFNGGSRSIQRAHVMFWGLNEEVASRLEALKSEENPNTFRPFHCSLAVSPIRLSSLAWDTSYTVGYVSLDIFGDGYFWPESFKSWIIRCSAEPAVQAACEACKRVWPRENESPDEQIISIRKNVENFWPYDDLYTPNDWAWGPEESG